MITLIQYFGDNPRIKVMNLFLENSKERYTKSAICRLTGVSRATLQEICKEFLKFRVLKKNGYYYYLNEYDKIVNMFLKFRRDFNDASFND